MLGLLDFLGEIGGALPYLYRGWFWLLSSKYRMKVKEEYTRHSNLYIGFDILMSVLFFGLECWILYEGINYAIGSNT